MGKYEQNLLLLLDDHSSWKEIRAQLRYIPDPWYDDGRCYNELRVDPLQWTEDAVYKHEVTRDDIVRELTECNMKYAPAMELLWRSNESLIPMRSWDADQYRMENGYNTAYIETHTASKICKSLLVAH